MNQISVKLKFRQNQVDSIVSNLEIYNFEMEDNIKNVRKELKCASVDQTHVAGNVDTAINKDDDVVLCTQ